MRDKLFALLSVVVLALAVAVPTTAQFASNDRSFRLRQTATANVTTPAAGSVAVFRDNLGAFSVKDSAGLVEGFLSRVTINNAAADTTLTAAYLGEVLVYDGAASQTITLPEITASNIGMRLVIVNADADQTVSVTVGAAADRLVDSTDGTVDADDIIVAAVAHASAEFIAINATTWLVIPTGTWTIA